ncbi:MAG: hypothetical protein WBD40_18120 [Tepidisphaeraceae bacterium]
MGAVVFEIPWWIPTPICLALMLWLVRGGMRAYRRSCAREYAAYLRRHHPEYDVLGEAPNGIRIRHVGDGGDRQLDLSQLFLLLGTLEGKTEAGRNAIFARFTERTLTDDEASHA